MKYIFTVFILALSLSSFANETPSSNTDTDGTEACSRPGVVNGDGAEAGGSSESGGQSGSSATGT